MHLIKRSLFSAWLVDLTHFCGFRPCIANFRSYYDLTKDEPGYAYWRRFVFKKPLVGKPLEQELWLRRKTVGVNSGQARSIHIVVPARRMVPQMTFRRKELYVLVWIKLGDTMSCAPENSLNVFWKLFKGVCWRRCLVFFKRWFFLPLTIKRTCSM